MGTTLGGKTSTARNGFPGATQSMGET